MTDAPSFPADAVSVFISYARADRARVAPIADVLRAHGYQVWWDTMLDGGAAFAKTIEAEIDRAVAVIVVWSAASVNSDWVRDEAGRGRDLKKLVAVTLDGAQAPLGFRQYHATDLSQWRGDERAPAIASVVRGVAAFADAPLPGASVAARAPSRRAVLLAGAGTGVAAVAAVVAWQFATSGRVGNSVAVLPFKNLSSDASQTYFSDGLSEEVRAALSRNAALQVAAPTSTGKFRDSGDDARTVGAKLGVAFLLEGSVRRANDVVRVTAELIDTATGFSKWSQVFDRKLTDIFAVQSEIAGIVAEALAVRVLAPDPKSGSTRNVAAYEAFLRGKTLFNADKDETSDRAALAQFDSAIALDPGYGAAYAARSRSLAAIASQYAKPAEIAGLTDAAVAAARRAVAIAPNLAMAQLALGYVLQTAKLDVRAAQAPYDRAYALGGGDADILVLYAIYTSRIGRADAAIAAVTRAMTLDPLNPRAFRAGGTVRYGARQFAEAMPLFRQALAFNPKLSSAHASLGNCLLLTGELRQARAEYALEPLDLVRLPGLAIADARLGDRAAAKASLAALVTTLGDSALYQQAQVLAQWGAREAALATLDRARAAGDAGLANLRIDPLFDPVRSDARFGRLLTVLGLA